MLEKTSSRLKVRCLLIHLVAVLFVFLSTACGVELRDKNKVESAFTELIVDGEYVLPAPAVQAQSVQLHYNRLVLRRGGKFITNGINARIEIDELISDDGIIASFSPDTVAAPQRNGRSGGKLDVLIHDAHGKLRFIKAGEGGGIGADGAAPDPSMKGAQGPAGANAICGLPFRSNDYPSGGATNGGPGAPGLVGKPGAIGAAGGNTGVTSLKILSVTDFTIQIFNLPGKGGPGGRGNVGGEGGDPGPAGNERCVGYHPNTLRNYTSDGPRGPTGPNGPDGARGQDGLEESFCAELGDAPLQCTGKQAAPENAIFTKASRN